MWGQEDDPDELGLRLFLDGSAVEIFTSTGQVGQTGIGTVRTEATCTSRLMHGDKAALCWDMPATNALLSYCQPHCLPAPPSTMATCSVTCYASGTVHTRVPWDVA